MAPVLYMQDFSGPVRSVLLTAAAIGLDLDKILVDISKREQFSDGYLKLNPQHTVPTLVDDGTVIWDSHAINAYLVDKYAKDDSLYPKDLARRAVVDQRLHFDTGCIFFWMKYMAKTIKYKKRGTLSPDQIEGLEEGFQNLDNFLKGRDWVAGDNVTIADHSLIANVTGINVATYPLDPERFPNIAAWLQRAQELPYYHVNVKGLDDYSKIYKPLLNVNLSVLLE